MFNLLKYSQSLQESFLSQFKPQSLKGLAAEALKVDSAKEFEKDYIIQIKHGTYWHITEDPNFQIDPSKGPKDMSSMAHGEMSVGKLMVTSDLKYWAENYKGLRGYAAEIDMSRVPKSDYYQVNRGFGNEFWVKDPSKAKVVRVVPLQQAFRINRYNHSKIPQSYEELESFYNRVHSDFDLFKERNSNVENGNI